MWNFTLNDLTQPSGAPPLGPVVKCWADGRLANGQPSSDSCQRVVEGCRIGLCKDCCAALCGTTAA